MKRGLTLAVVFALCLLAGPASAETREIRTVALQHMEPTRAAALYESVVGVGPGGKVHVAEKKRAVIVHDERRRIDHFRGLVALLDVPGSGDLKIFVRPVQFASPTELAKILGELLQGTSHAKGLLLVPDERSSKLVVRASPETYRMIDKLLRRQDTRK